jgi:N-acetylmuramoyl-L-alanine amidase
MLLLGLLSADDPGQDGRRRAVGGSTVPLQRSVAALASILALTAGGSAAYTVRPGDTLSEIARRAGVSMADLVRANGIDDPDHVVAGRTLSLPGGAPVASSGRSHVVVRGDTLSGIARRQGTTVAALVAANQLPNADHVRIGARLTVPPAGGAGSSTAVPGNLPLRLREAPERLALVSHFRHWARANGIAPDLLMATTWLESGWQNDVVSSVGAMGIGQLMPATVEFVRRDLIGVPSLDPRVPADNIRMSARYLRWLLSRTNGDVRTALAGYYQGPRSVQIHGPYPGTVRYVDDVLSLRHRFAG